MPQFLQLYQLLPQFIRTADAAQAWHTVSTTLGTPVVAGSPQTVTPADINGIKLFQSLTIDPGQATEEVVTVISVTITTFTAFFNQSHFATAIVTDATLPPLAALLAAAQKQADLVYQDIWTLRDNFFVETCKDWVLPYIADLIALNLIDDDPANNRREVARTIAYRRRKGTVPQLETMAYDVTGYSARVREFFESMLWNQCMFHFKPADVHTADISDASALARIGQAFDRTSHTADLRPSTERQGWYNLPKVGFFMWRLKPCPLTGIPASPAPNPAPPGAYHFNVFGQPELLFQNTHPPDPGVDTDWPRATELTVMSPISPQVFVESPGEFWNTPEGFTIYVGGVPLTAPAPNLPVIAANLCSWTAPQLQPGQVAVDVRLGRFMFHPASLPNLPVTTDYSFGFSGDVGGGNYDRTQNIRPGEGETGDVVHVSAAFNPPAAGQATSINQALQMLGVSVAALRVVQIEDSLIYSEALQLPANFDTLVIQAANNQRPTLELTNVNNAFVGPCQGVQLVLSGLLITGAGQTLTIPTGITSVLVQDCTIDPGGGRAADGVSSRPAGVILKMAPPATACNLRIDHSIVGPLDLPTDMGCLALADSIADATAFPQTQPPQLPPILVNQTGPPCTVLRSSLFGSFNCYSLEASLGIFTGLTNVMFRQQGCVRFCYFAPNSLVPRKYECAPDTPPPAFTSTLFGDPGYAQLVADCQSTAIPTNCTGSPIAYGENGVEMGVWSSLGNLRRLNHLRLRLTEYLPAGLVPLFIFET